MSKKTTAFVFGLYAFSLAFCFAPPLSAYPTLLDWLSGILLGIGIGLTFGPRFTGTSVSERRSAEGK